MADRERNASAPAVLVPDNLVDLLREWVDLADRQTNPARAALSTGEEERFWWLAVQGLHLLAVALERGQETGRTDPIPNGITHLLNHTALAIGGALRGKAPEPWRPEGKPKTPPDPDLVVATKGFAAAYLRLADDGTIPDTAPVETVRTAFGVAPSTARGFRRHECVAELAAMRAAFAGVSGPPDRMPELILEEAKTILGRAGKAYRRKHL